MFKDSISHFGKTKSVDLSKQYAYRSRYINDMETFMKSVLTKTVIPHQIEVQPGRIGGKELCWMKCPYCYGGTATNTGDRLTPERYIDIIRQTAHGPHGRVHKAIFAGYATDPLNYEHIDDLIAQSRDCQQVIGIHTKALRVSDRLVNLLTSPDVQQLSYFSVSLDAGLPKSYNAVHGIESTADVYGLILENLKRLVVSRNQSGAALDISVTYLITRLNNTVAEIEKSIRDMTEIGVDLLRFSFPQIPRGYQSDDGTIIPSRGEVEAMMNRLTPVINAVEDGPTRVLLVDYDHDLAILDSRTMPCISRFVFPSVGFDGFLAFCSESAAPHFRDMALGNLATNDFWDVFYDYDAENFWQYIEQSCRKMEKNDCRCDRKEHALNSLAREFKPDYASLP